MEHLEARPLQPHPDPGRARHLPVLPQRGPAEVQALRLAHPHGPGPAGPAHLDTGVLRQGSRAPLRALLHQGSSGGHERSRQRHPRRRGVPDPRQHDLRREHDHARIRAGPVRRRPALLLFFERRPTPAHVLAARRPRASRLRRKPRPALRRRHRPDLRRDGPSPRLGPAQGRQGHRRAGHVRPRFQ